MTKYKEGDFVYIREDIDLILNLCEFTDGNPKCSMTDCNVNELRGTVAVVSEVVSSNYSGNRYKLTGDKYYIPEENLKRFSVDTIRREGEQGNAKRQ